MLPHQPHDHTSGHVEQGSKDDLHPLLRKITENLKLIGVVLGAIVLVAAGYSGFTLFKQRQIAAAQNELGQILTQQNPEQAAQAMADFLPQAPSSMRQGVRLEMARLSMEAEDYAQAQNAWQGLLDSTPSEDPLHTVATFGLAKTQRLQDQPENALQTLEDIRGDIAEPYRQFLLTELAATAEAAQEWQTAISTYKTLRDSQDTRQKDFLEYKINQLQKHNTDAAS